MATIADFERFVLPFVAGAPAPAVEDALIDSAIEFCQRTRCVRLTLDPIKTKLGVVSYDIDPPDMDSQIVRVMGARLGGEVLTLLNPTDTHLPGLMILSQSDLTLMNIDPAGSALLLDVALAPTRSAREFPDVLLNVYAEAISAGALARLHSHANAVYADATRVQSYLSTFNRAIMQSADDAAHSFAHIKYRARGDEWV